jgi:aquaglyceroporin related protein
MENQTTPPETGNSVNSRDERTGTWPNMNTTETYHYKEHHTPQGWSPDTQRVDSVPSEDPQGGRPRKKTSHSLEKTRGVLGLHPKAPIDETHDEAEHQDLLWSRIRLTFREPFAEFLGTFVLVLFGDGSVAQVLLSKGQATAPGKINRQQ